MEPESSKILGGIGAILMLIGPFGASYTRAIGHSLLRNENTTHSNTDNDAAAFFIR
jgi:hypothetical protein